MSSPFAPYTVAISTRKISGSMKLKNAADGLRQKLRRSKRNWLQASTAVLIAPPPRRLFGLGRGQLQVDVLERRPGDGQVLQRLAARERLARQLVQ